MEVVVHPSALPAACLFCPGSVRDRYIDTNLSMDWYGAVYVCDECVIAMGRMIGMITQDQASVLIEENAEAASKVYRLQIGLSQFERMKEAFSGLSDAGFISTDDSDDDSILSARLEYPEGRFTQANGESPGREASVGSGEGETTEQVHVEGVGDVRSDDNSDGSAFDLAL